MQRAPVRSESLRSVGYDVAASTLEVEFKHGGVYQYFMVPASVVVELLESDSMGAFVNQRIKPHYPFEQIR